MEHTDPNSKPDIKIPESITIDGKDYSVKDTPELMGLVTAASRVEKNKLYSKIKTLQDGIEGLKRVELAASTPPDSLKEEILESVRNIVEGAIKPLLDKTSKIEIQSLEEYKAKLLTENEGKCFPELVKGNTKEEVDESLKNSIELRTKYSTDNPANNQQGKVTDPAIVRQNAALDNNQQQQPNAPAAQQSTPSTTPAPIVPIVPNVPVNNPSMTDIGKMSQEEFARNREKLEAEIKTLV